MLNPKILRQWYNSISLNKYFAYNDLIMSGAEPELELLSTNIHNTQKLVKGSTFAGEYERLCICSAASKEHLQQKAFRFEVEVFRSTYITQLYSHLSFSFHNINSNPINQYFILNIKPYSFINQYLQYSFHIFIQIPLFTHFHQISHPKTTHIHPEHLNKQEKTMRMQSLIAELKQLKSSKPVVEPPINKKRLERVMLFEQANGISLDPNKSRKKQSKKGGMFDGIIFCFPLIDPPNDPSPEKLVKLAKGIYSQGGKLVQFNYDLVNRMVKYILIDRKSDVGYVREVLKGKIIYTTILDYMWVEECLRVFRKLELAAYNLQICYMPQQNRLNQQNKADRSIINKSPKKRALGEFIHNTVHKIRFADNNKQTRIPINTSQPQSVNHSQDIEPAQPQQKQKIDGQARTDRHSSQGDSNSSTVQMEQEERQQFDQIAQIQQKSANQLNQEQLIKLEQSINQPSSIIQHAIKTEQNSLDYQIKYENDEIKDEIKDEASQSSGGTEKIQSDNEQQQKQRQPTTITNNKNADKKHCYFRVAKSQPKIKQQQKQQQIEQAKEPEINRRKTKLSIGSHQFSTNNIICEKLKQMQQIYEDTGDRKKFAYLRAIAAIRNYGKEIRNAEELRNIQGLGSKTIDKIKEFLQTGSITKVENRLKKTNSVPYKELLRVYGIGPTTAEQLYHKGIRSIQDLWKNQELLNKNQKMGLRYVNDLQQRIPRQKVSSMLKFVRQTLYYVVRSDSHHQIQAVGSYRRGKESCGDIDILITRKDGYVQKNLLGSLVLELEKRKFITDHITQPRIYDGRKSVNYMGVCVYQTQTHHRIDLKHYPADQYAFALLYFTGSDLFNREMRIVATEKGLILGDHGVRKVQRAGMGKVWRNGKIPVCLKEQDIFTLLGMEYRSPGQRQL